jgi:hypothetical protein
LKPCDPHGAAMGPLSETLGARLSVDYSVYLSTLQGPCQGCLSLKEGTHSVLHEVSPGLEVPPVAHLS